MALGCVVVVVVVVDVVVVEVVTEVGVVPPVGVVVVVVVVDWQAAITRDNTIRPLTANHRNFLVTLPPLFMWKIVSLYLSNPFDSLPPSL